MNAREILQQADVAPTGWRTRVLKAFTASGEPYTPKELQRFIRAEGDYIHSSTLHRVVRELEKAGLLACQIDGKQRLYRRNATRSLPSRNS